MSMPPLPITFSGSVVHGAGRGREMGSPTINIDVSAIPANVPHGIYACLVRFNSNDESQAAAVHYGPRPAFRDDDVAFEVHVLDARIDTPPATVSVDVIAYLREVRNFESKELLMEQIQRDIEQTRAILSPSS